MTVDVVNRDPNAINGHLQVALLINVLCIRY